MVGVLSVPVLTSVPTRDLPPAAGRAPTPAVARRYVAWLDRRRRAVIALAALCAVGAALLCARLHLRADLSNLLPTSQRSVLDLDRLRHRARGFGSLVVAVEAPTPEARAVAARTVEGALTDLDPALVVDVATDAAAAARYAWRYRYQLAPPDELRAVRDRLRERLDAARLEANPLYVDLDDAPPAHDAAAEDDPLAALEQRLAELETAAQAPRERVSHDGTIELFSITASFPATDAAHGKVLLRELRARIGALALGDGVHVYFTSSIPFSVAEHDSVITGMVVAALVTLGLCACGLLFYYRTAWGVLAVLFALAVGVLATFAITALTIGHLNLLSAFLAAIVVGNGINSALLVLARYLEEARRNDDPAEAMAAALAGALRGTSAAALAAAIAYASLVATDFRGFRHFGMIASLGMVLSWATAFTVLPATLLGFARRGRLRAPPPPALGQWLARALTWRPRLVAVVGSVTALAAAGIATVYLVRDPFARDWRDLRASSRNLRALRALDGRLERGFGGSHATVMTYQILAALPTAADVPPTVRAIRTLERTRPAGKPLLAEVLSLEDVVPSDQPERLALLADIRRLVDDALANGDLTDREAARLRELRPPDGLAPVTLADVPPSLTWPFIEQDGSAGKLVLLRGAPRFRTWDIGDRLEFADQIRTLPLPPDTLLAGESLVVADIVRVMKRDAPVMITVALLGAALTIVLIVGLGRHAGATIIAAGAGVATMIALCALVGLRVHFLDLIALPITIGIGIDYAVNLAARHREDGGRGDAAVLSTTGSAVLMCSFTTTVGYASLLLSANGGIRSFGLASMLGEIACLTMALVLVPAVLGRRGLDRA